MDGNGKAAVNFEHSWGDGVAVLRLVREICRDSRDRPALQHATLASAPPTAKQVLFRALGWFWLRALITLLHPQKVLLRFDNDSIFDSIDPQHRLNCRREVDGWHQAGDRDCAGRVQGAGQLTRD